MSTFIFILGKDRELSLAELVSVYGVDSVEVVGGDFVTLNLNVEFGQKELNRLGGTIKVARLVGEVEPKKLAGALTEVVAEHYDNRKVNYGLSFYDTPESNLRRTLLEMKKKLKKDEISSRFANQDFKNISAAQYKGLCKEGFELVAAKTKEGFLVGQVVAVQDIDAYSRRDFEKPFRSMKVGMLPPKLAQILVNLTEVQSGTVWDPFCGGGVLLMEAMLLGFDVMGSDIDEVTLDGARKNVGWLQKELDVHQKADLFLHDATRPLKGKKWSAIACEGYLGPPQIHLSPIRQLQPLLAELERLYVEFFRALKEVGHKVPVVIAMPFFKTREGRDVFLDLALEAILQMGFKQDLFLPDTPMLKYARADQGVGRAIYRFIFE